MTASVSVDINDKDFIIGYHFAPVAPGEVDPSEGNTRTKVAICVFVVIGVLTTVGMLMSMGNPIAERDIFPILQVIAPISFCVAGIIWFVDVYNEDIAPGTKKIAIRREDLDFHLPPNHWVNLGNKKGFLLNRDGKVEYHEYMEGDNEEAGPEVKKREGDAPISKITLAELYQLKQTAIQSAAHKQKVNSLD